MTYGTITVGRLTLREAYTPADDRTDATTGESSVTFTGQESSPPLTAAQLRQRREDLTGMLGQLVPVVCTDKETFDGFYQVTDVGASLVEVAGQAEYFDWNLSLARVGSDTSVDVESRLTGVARGNDFTLTGERWHAPSAPASGYYTGTTQPSIVVRTGADGAMNVYRDVPASTNPRWYVVPEDYYDGAAKVTVGSLTRAASNVSMSTSGWTLENSLVKVAPGVTDSFTISAHDGTQWEAKAWNVSIGTSGAPAVTTWDAASIIRNDPECCTIRLMKGGSPGRSLLDLTLRRGSRVVEGYLQTDRSTTLGLFLTTPESLSNQTANGYVIASSDDAAGNKCTAGTARSCTYNTNLGFYKSSTTTFGFYAGVVMGGSSAVSGDDAVSLREQYILSPAETTMFVRR